MYITYNNYILLLRSVSLLYKKNNNKKLYNKKN